MTSVQTTAATTIVTTSGKDNLSPIERAIMDACNALHEARDRNDTDSIGSLKAALHDLLDRYDATDGDDHPNPAWARATQRALALSAMGELDKAIALELTAIKYADTPRRREISSGNIADRLIRSGDPQGAIGFFLDAYEQSPDSVPILLTGAVALHEAGYDDQAQTIYATLADNPALLAGSSELGAYLTFDRRTRAAAGACPAGRELLATWDAMVSEGGAS